MSIANTLTALGVLLLTANPTPQPALTRVITSPKEWENAADLPHAILRLDGEGHTMSIEALQLGRLDYTVRIDVLIGIAETPLIELHDRAKYWPLALLTALTSDMTLGGTIAFTGGASWAVPFEIGFIQDFPDFWGLTLRLPVTEKPVITGMN
jgi:hypothetical protein